VSVIDELLKETVEKNGSDLHFVAGDPPRIRQYGELQTLRPKPISQEEAETELGHIMTRKATKGLEKRDGADFAYTLGDVARFRVNVFRHLGGLGGVFRTIPSETLTMVDLGMPAAVSQLCRSSSGLILVTGKTGSGKSTTLAAMIDSINKRIQGHIITIEDPIEFIHKRVNCLISQREIGAHTKSFASALHSALREDPDVVLVGEMRDLETMSIAVTAAEMGILVMGTLHTNGAAATVDRIVHAFPAEKQGPVRSMLSTSLVGVISQQLVKRSDKDGRVAAFDILINNSAIANLIRQGKLDQLENTMASSAGVGMCTMDGSLMALYNKGTISAEEAYMKSLDKKKFEEIRNLETQRNG
jgi:twitching motility protein PilT